MKSFGFEIRKAGSINSLYEDVDKILEGSGLDKSDVTIDIQIQAVAHTLHKMLKPNTHFSICTIDKCVEISQVVISKERYDVYSSIHCMSWSEMEESFRQNIIAMVLDDFRSVLMFNS
jgi:hypothetical protein